MSENTPDRVTALVVAAGVTVLGVIASGVTGVIGGFAGALFGASDPEAAVPLVVALLIAASEAGFALVGYAFRRYGDAGVSVAWAPGGPTANDAALVVVATVALVGLNRSAFFFAETVGGLPISRMVTPEAFSVELFVLLVPALLFAVGPAEEYLFRGVLQRYLGRSFSTRGAVGLAALLFTLVHLPNLVSNPAAAPVSIPLWFVLGVAFGWLYERTDRLLVPVAVHGLYNVAVLGFLLR